MRSADLKQPVKIYGRARDETVSGCSSLRSAGHAQGIQVVGCDLHRPADCDETMAM